MASAAWVGQAERRNAPGSTSATPTWVLDSGATNHMAARDTGFAIKTAGSGENVTPADSHKVPIKGHGRASMDVVTGNTTARMVVALRGSGSRSFGLPDVCGAPANADDVSYPGLGRWRCRCWLGP